MVYETEVKGTRYTLQLKDDNGWKVNLTIDGSIEESVAIKGISIHAIQEGMSEVLRLAGAQINDFILGLMTEDLYKQASGDENLAQHNKDMAEIKEKHEMVKDGRAQHALASEFANMMNINPEDAKKNLKSKEDVEKKEREVVDQRKQEELEKRRKEEEERLIQQLEARQVQDGKNKKKDKKDKKKEFMKKLEEAKKKKEAEAKAEKKEKPKEEKKDVKDVVSDEMKGAVEKPEIQAMMSEISKTVEQPITQSSVSSSEVLSKPVDVIDTGVSAVDIDDLIAELNETKRLLQDDVIRINKRMEKMDNIIRKISAMSNKF